MQPVGGSNVLRIKEVNHMLLRSSLILFVICFLAQIDGAQTPSPEPTDLKVLPGYSSTETIGKDGKATRLVRPDGFTITYLSSSPKNFYERSFKSGDGIVWVKNQSLNGHEIRVAWTKSGEMIVIIDDTQMFRAKPEKLDHVADLLLTVASFYSKKDEPAPVTPSVANPPGNMRLLAGYTYVRRRGIDSHVGSIVGEGEFTINHDIGGMASNYSREYFPDHFEQLRKQTHLNKDAIESHIRYLEQQVSWQVRQQVNGDDLMIVYFKDGKLIASFDHSTANFIAKVDSFDQMTDFFLTVLTYQPKPSNKLPK